MNAEYVLILGGPIDGEKPSGILFERVKKGAELLKADESLKAVCSGGIKDEAQLLSEAQIMKNTLLELGISGDRIILESEAKTTLQNFQYTKKLLGDDARVAFVTSKFHIWRSKRIMKKAGVCYEAIPAPNGVGSLGFIIREQFLKPLALFGIIW